MGITHINITLAPAVNMHVSYSLMFVNKTCAHNKVVVYMHLDASMFSFTNIHVHVHTVFPGDRPIKLC